MYWDLIIFGIQIDAFHNDGYAASKARTPWKHLKCLNVYKTY